MTYTFVKNVYKCFVCLKSSIYESLKLVLMKIYVVYKQYQTNIYII